jgi:type II secretory pathway component HofQ
MRFLRIYFIFIIILLLSSAFYTFAQEPEQIAESKTAQEGKQAEEAVAQQPIMEIKPLETEESLYSVELRDVEIKDLLRVLAHNYNLNILVDRDIKGKITASLTNISLEEALERIADMHNLILEKKGNVIIAKPNLVSKVFILKYLNAEELLGAFQGKEKKQGEEGEAGLGASTIYDLLSPEGKILLGKQLNSIVVIDYPPNVKKIGGFLKVADQEMATSVFKLKYFSVKELFPELVVIEREERKKQREERKEERGEIKEMKQKEGGG